MSNVLLPVIVLTPLVAALVVVLGRPDGRRAGRWATATTSVAVTAAFGLTAGVWANGRVSWVLEHDGRATIGLTADLVGAVLATLTASVGLVVLSFARRSLDGDPRAPRFFGLASLLTSATGLVALAATGTGLAVGWVATSAALVALVGHRSGWRPATDAARRTRTAFAVSDLAIGAAVLVALLTIGDLDLRSVADDAGALWDRRITVADVVRIDVATAVAVLLVIGGIARSALVPLHRWLPSTVAAPTPVSALLHAGVVNGAGVLVVRTAPLTGSSAAAMGLLFAAGVVTATLATAVMLVRTDVKGGLAWSTAGQMGFMAVQLAVGAFAAAAFHLVGHAMYKAARFLGAGDAIARHGRARHAPRADVHVRPLPARALAATVPAAGVWIGFTIVDPHLPTAGAVLVATFGWCSAASALGGWWRTAPASVPAIGLGVALGIASPIAYLGGVALFESAVAGDVPFGVTGAVSTPWLIAVIATVATGAAAVRWAPGSGAAAARRALYGALLGYSVPPAAGHHPRPERAGEEATTWITLPAIERTSR